MSTIIHIVVDATLSAGWWVIRRASYGIYSGTHYLIWGKTETPEEVREKKIMTEIEDIKKTQENILSEIQNRKESSPNKEIAPPTYSDVVKEKNADVLKEDNEGFEMVPSNQIITIDD